MAQSRTKLSALVLIAAAALFGPAACSSAEKGQDEESNLQSVSQADQVCVGGGTCGSGWHCCGDGTRDWCCPQTSGCGTSWEHDACH